MPDYFNTTYEGAYKSGSSIGNALLDISDKYYKQKLQEKQAKQELERQKNLKQFSSNVDINEKNTLRPLEEASDIRKYQAQSDINVDQYKKETPYVVDRFKQQTPYELERKRGESDIDLEKQKQLNSQQSTLNQSEELYKSQLKQKEESDSIRKMGETFGLMQEKPVTSDDFENKSKELAKKNGINVTTKGQWSQNITEEQKLDYWKSLFKAHNIPESEWPQLTPSSEIDKKKLSEWMEKAPAGVETLIPGGKFKSPNSKNDLNLIQRIAATKGVPPEGNRIALLDNIAKASNQEKEVVTIDPITGEQMNSFTTGPRSIVRKGVISPEQMKSRAAAEGEGKAIQKDIEQTSKLGTAVKRLAILNTQFSEALPSGDKTPLEQRISGNIENFKVKYGLSDNKKLLALQQNIRPMAINLVRAFGEVGNLSESEQKGAVDVIDSAGLTDSERIEKTKQFIEFALAGARPESIDLLKKRKDITGVLDAFGVNLGDSDIKNNAPMQGKTSSGIGYTIEQ